MLCRIADLIEHLFSKSESTLASKNWECSPCGGCILVVFRFTVYWQFVSSSFGWSLRLLFEWCVSCLIFICWLRMLRLSARQAQTWWGALQPLITCCCVNTVLDTWGLVLILHHEVCIHCFKKMLHSYFWLNAKVPEYTTLFDLHKFGLSGCLASHSSTSNCGGRNPPSHRYEKYKTVVVCSC